MRVAIDVTTALTQSAGIGRYTRELYTALIQQEDAPELIPFAVTSSIKASLPGRVAPVLRRRSAKAWRMEIAARHLLHLPAHGPWDGADLYHATDHVYPPVSRLPVVVTVHDLTFLLFPHFHTRFNSAYLRWAVPIMCRTARRISADSHSTRRDIIEHFGIHPERIQVVYPCIAGTLQIQPAAKQVAETRQRLGVPETFILSVGTLEPRKNLAGTLSAYRVLKDRGKDLPPLVLVGATGWSMEALGQQIHALEGKIIRLGYITDSDLAALYSASLGFIYPSYYEGFGLPVAEAMRFGAPVLTSSTSSLPEVTGDAAILVDPNSTESIAEGLERLIFDHGEAARLREAGPRQVAQFSGERCARGTIELYRQASEG